MITCPYCNAELTASKKYMVKAKGEVYECKSCKDKQFILDARTNNLHVRWKVSPKYGPASLIREEVFAHILSNPIKASRWTSISTGLLR